VTNLASNGIFQGYRWYDQHGVQPLFPFGFGLSYTSFDYSGLRVEPARDGGLEVSFRVRNVGSRQGAEVPQVYIGPGAGVPTGVQQAVRSLVQFTRVELAPGQVGEVRLHVAPRQLSYWSTAQQGWVVATGLRQVFVGASSRDLRLSASVLVRPGGPM
jgi:beta-glucosidase